MEAVGRLSDPSRRTVYRVEELARCRVFTSAGECLGAIVDVLPSGGNDIFVIDHGGQELLIPALKSVVLSVDLAARRIEVDLPPGLLEIYGSATPPAD